MFAKAFVGILVLMVGSTIQSVAAETNTAVHFTGVFVLSEPDLRDEFMAMSSPSVATKPVHLETHLSASFLATTDSDDVGFQHCQRFELIKPTPKDDDLMNRCLKSVFQPEEVHLGKTTVSCSILTAIKRKNPLCLINPNFLNVSW